MDIKNDILNGRILLVCIVLTLVIGIISLSSLKVVDEQKSPQRFESIERYNSIHCYLVKDNKTGKHYLIRIDGGIKEVTP